ncbi:MAG: hypothetical protein R3C56_10160 [Pirellulaceae bacterium]
MEETLDNAEVNSLDLAQRMQANSLSFSESHPMLVEPSVASPICCRKWAI